jgi:hypothetical protein
MLDVERLETGHTQVKWVSYPILGVAAVRESFNYQPRFDGRIDEHIVGLRTTMPAFLAQQVATVR